MFYKVIGVMSGSSLDGLDIVFVGLEESGGKWKYEIIASQCNPYSNEWYEKLHNARHSSAYDYLLLHHDFGKYIGDSINGFIEKHDLHHQVQLIASHGHTVFHEPKLGLTSQLGDGSAIAATTEINVVSDLRSLDVAFGGQGAPIVPIGEKLLFTEYDLLLNIGGIANLSCKSPTDYIGFDVCAANRVLNMLAQTVSKPYDEAGKMAAAGKIDTTLLTRLNSLSYYADPYPKTLSNNFGTDEVFPLIQSYDFVIEDKLRTYTEHVAMQIGYAVQNVAQHPIAQNGKLLITGGGAFNTFLIDRIKVAVQASGIEAIVPDEQLICYKEALIMALIGTLRWREEYNVLHTVTGATRSSIGGAVWIGQEA